jgi:hypothetical protein
VEGSVAPFVDVVNVEIGIALKDVGDLRVLRWLSE